MEVVSAETHEALGGSRRELIAHTLGAAKKFSSPPNLLRAAVISSPLLGKDGEEIHEELNRRLVSGIGEAAIRASKYFENDTWTKTPMHPFFKPPKPQRGEMRGNSTNSISR